MKPWPWSAHKGRVATQAGRGSGTGGWGLLLWHAASAVSACPAAAGQPDDLAWAPMQHGAHSMATCGIQAPATGHSVNPPVTLHCPQHTHP